MRALMQRAITEPVGQAAFHALVAAISLPRHCVDAPQIKEEETLPQYQDLVVQAIHRINQAVSFVEALDPDLLESEQRSAISMRLRLLVGAAQEAIERLTNTPILIGG